MYTVASSVPALSSISCWQWREEGGAGGAGTVVSATIIEGEYCIKKFDCEYYVLVLEFNYGKADANKQGVGPGYQQPSTNSLRAIGYWALQLCL